METAALSLLCLVKGCRTEGWGTGVPKSVLDFGCSFGHLLDQFDDRWTTSGCDVVPALVDHVGAQGKHHVALSVDGLELAAESQGLVFAIDSLYCLSDPRPLLGKLHRVLSAEGHLVLRVTNRNQLWKGYLFVRRAMGRRTSLMPEVPHPVAGDAMLSFSLRSLRRLLRESGFEIVTTYRWERKPLSPLVRLRELIALIGHRLTGGLVDLNSGLVVVAKKRPNAAV